MMKRTMCALVSLVAMTARGQDLQSSEESDRMSESSLTDRALPAKMPQGSQLSTALAPGGKQHPGMLLKHGSLAPGVQPKQEAFAAGIQAAAAPTGAHLKYYGGRVIENVEIVGVFWGANVAARTRSGVADFLPH